MNFKTAAKFTFGCGMAMYTSYYISSLMNEEHSFFGPYEDLKQRKNALVTNGSNTDTSQYFVNKNGMRIHISRWLPIKGFHPAIRGVVVFLHDYGGCADLYHDFAKKLNKVGYAVYSFDVVGHGRSEGDRGFVKWFSDYVEDVLYVTELAKKENRGTENVFLIGHGMGGTLAIQSARTCPRLYTGIILASPFLSTQFSDNTKRVVSFLSGAFPKLGIMDIPWEDIFTDKDSMDRYANDPLVMKGQIPARTCGELMLQLQDIKRARDHVTFPFLLLNGNQDRVTRIDASQDFYDETNSTDKKMIKYENIGHDLFHNPNVSDDVTTEVVSWLNARST